MKAAGAVIGVITLLWSFEARAYEVKKDVALRAGGYEIPVSVSLPDSTAGLSPVMFFVHGGGWNGGDDHTVPGAQIPNDCEFLCDQMGIIYVGLAYRCKGNKGTFHLALEDLEASVSWFMERAEEFNADTSRIGFSGASAGTTLAAVLAHRYFNCKVYVGSEGMYNLLDQDTSLSHFPSASGRSAYGLLTHEQLLEASPYHQVRNNPASALLLHGKDDWLCHYSQSEKYGHKLRQAGGQCRVVLYEGINHTCLNMNYPEVFRNSIMEIARLYKEGFRLDDADLDMIAGEVDASTTLFYPYDHIPDNRLSGTWKSRFGTLVLDQGGVGTLIRPNEMLGRDVHYVNNGSSISVSVSGEEKERVFYLRKNDQSMYELILEKNRYQSRRIDYTKPPNIILILADDLGYGDLHAFGGGYGDTPHLDRMAREGVMFTDFHSNGPVCSPTRAALLSGQYQQRAGIEHVVFANKFRHTGMTPGTFTLADQLKSQGYATAIFGKWHLGYDTLYSPLNFGFETFKGYVSGNVDYHAHIDGEGYHDWWRQKKKFKQAGYTTDLISSYAVSYIKEHTLQPFFLYIAHEAPHFPYQGRNDEAIRSIGDGSLENQHPDDVRKVYREMIAAMDEGIGEVMDALEETGQSRNTFIFFLSDNGASRAGSNDPFRGYKSSLWEGGHRVPALAYWPGKISAGRNHTFLLGMDLFPTVVSITGGHLPPELTIDGRDFSEILWSGEKTMNERTAFWRFTGDRAVRKGPWKLLVLADSTYLFHIANDPAESVNLISSHQEIAGSLDLALSEWETEMNRYVLRTY